MFGGSGGYCMTGGGEVTVIAHVFGLSKEFQAIKGMGVFGQLEADVENCISCISSINVQKCPITPLHLSQKTSPAT